MSYTDFKNRWLGGHTDYDGQQRYQCVDLVRRYWAEEYQFPGGGGLPTAISYWSMTTQEIKDHFDRVEGSNPIQGDAVILRTLNRTDYSGDGHIGIATGGLTADQVEILEQNGSTGSGDGIGGNAIRTRWVARSRVAGLLRHRVPAPAAPAAPPYWIEDIAPVRVRMNKTQHRWGMTYDNFTAMDANPLAERPVNEEFEAVAVCHHHIGYNYYLADRNEPIGINVADADPIPVPPPAPYVPPAPPVEYPKPEEYTVVTKLMRFNTVSDAIEEQNYSGEDIQPGTYIVFAKADNAYNLTDQNHVNRDWWVNITKNVEPAPEPENPLIVGGLPIEEVSDPNAEEEPQELPEDEHIPVRIEDVKKPEPPVLQPDLTWQKMAPFFTDGRTVPYRASNQQAIDIYDLETKQYLGKLVPGKEMRLVGTFEFNGRKYGMTLGAWNEGAWPNIPMGMVKINYFQIVLNEIKKFKPVQYIDGIFKKGN